MATYIRKLKDLHGSYVLPATRSAAIYMSNNQKLEDYLTDMEDDLMNQIASGSVDFSRATASTSDVLSGETFYAGNKTLKTGTLSLAATATESDVRSGKTFYAGSKEIKTGTYTSSISVETITSGIVTGSKQITISDSSIKYVIGDGWIDNAIPNQRPSITGSNITLEKLYGYGTNSNTTVMYIRIDGYPATITMKPTGGNRLSYSFTAIHVN